MDASLTATATVAPGTRRARLAELAPFAVLALWTLAITVLLARIGVENRYVFRDEANAVLLGRDITRDLSFAIEGSVARGPERMTSLLAALAVWLSDSPTRQLELLHLWTAIEQALVTVPIWLAARELGLTRWQALVPAAIASSGSFAFYGIFTLNTSVGMLTATFLLWAMIRALRRPGVVSDLLVAGTLALLVVARIGWAPLVVALAPAVLAATWFARPAGERIGGWLRRLPVRLLRRHPLLLPAAILVAAYVLLAGPSALLGGEQYGGIRLAPAFVWSLAWDNTRTLLAHLAIGLAIVPLVLALPMLGRSLMRPFDALEGGFAWLVLALLIAFSYAYYASMNEDRYFAVLAPPLALAAALAVFRRPPPLWSVLASGGAVVLLVGTSSGTLGADPVYGNFIAPTWRFLDDAVLRRLAVALPDDRDLLAAGVALIAALAAGLVAWILRRPRPLGRATVASAALVLAGVLAFQLAAMDHPARKLTERVGLRGVPAESLEFVDRTTDGVVRPLAVDSVMDPDLSAQLQLLQAYNSAVTGPYFVTRQADPAIPTDTLIDWRTGEARIVSAQPPDYLLQVAGAAPVAFAGTILPPNPAFPWAQLVRLDKPLRALWAMRGMQPDRYPRGGTPIELRVFADDAPDRCVTGQIFAHPTLTGAVQYQLAGGRRALAGRVIPTRPVTFSRPLERGRPVTFTLTGDTARGADRVERGPTLYDIRIVRCPERG